MFTITGLRYFIGWTCSLLNKYFFSGSCAPRIIPRTWVPLGSFGTHICVCYCCSRKLEDKAVTHTCDMWAVDNAVQPQLKHAKPRCSYTVLLIHRDQDALSDEVAFKSMWIKSGNSTLERWTVNPHSHLKHVVLVSLKFRVEFIHGHPAFSQ